MLVMNPTSSFSFIFSNAVVIPVCKPKVTPSEKKYRQDLFPDVKDIRNKNLLCTSCGGSVKDLISKGKPIIHPFLETLLCEKCHSFYGDGQFSVDEDGSDKYCRWCGQGGTLFLCSKCSSGFCKRCVKRNLPKSAQAKIEDDDWVCYCCDTVPLYELRAQCWAAQQYAAEYTKSKGSSKSKKSLRESSKRSRDSGSSGSEEELRMKKKRKEDSKRKSDKKQKNGEDKEGSGGGGRLLRKRDGKAGSDSEPLSEPSSGGTLPSGVSVDRIHAALNKLSSFVAEIAGMTKETHRKLLDCKNKKLNMKNVNSIETVLETKSKLSSMMVSLETNVQMVRKALEGYVEEWSRMAKEDLKVVERGSEADKKVEERERPENGLLSADRMDMKEAVKSKEDEVMEVEDSEIMDSHEQNITNERPSNVERKSSTEEDGGSAVDEHSSRESVHENSEQRIELMNLEEEKSVKDSVDESQVKESNMMIETKVPSEHNNEQTPSTEKTSIKENDTLTKES